MFEQQSYLRIAELEYFARQMLLMRTLIEYPQSFQPRANTLGVPAVAITRYDQLMPIASARVPGYGAPERLGALGHQLAVFFGRRGVAQRLMRQITTIAHQVPQERDLLVRPDHRGGNYRKSPRDGNTITNAQLPDDSPSVSGKNAMVGRRSKISTAGKLQTKYLPHALGPYQVALRLDDFLVFTHRPNFGRGADQFANRHALTAGQTYQGFSGDALGQVRHHRLLVLPLLHATVELRQRDDGYLEFLGQRLERS